MARRYGIHQGRDRTGRGRAFEETLSWMELLGLDRETMSIFVEERARLRAAGQALADFDLLIGATAIRHGLELVTRNVRHFERMPRLSVSRMLVD